MFPLARLPRTSSARRHHADAPQGARNHRVSRPAIPWHCTARPPSSLTSCACLSCERRRPRRQRSGCWVPSSGARGAPPPVAPPSAPPRSSLAAPSLKSLHTPPARARPAGAHPSARGPPPACRGGARPRPLSLLWDPSCAGRPQVPLLRLQDEARRTRRRSGALRAAPAPALPRSGASRPAPPPWSPPARRAAAGRRQCSLGAAAVRGGGVSRGRLSSASGLVAPAAARRAPRRAARGSACTSRGRAGSPAAP